MEKILVQKIKNDLATQAKQIMKTAGVKYSVEAEADKILLEYVNFRVKMIPKRRRSVKFSDELSRKISAEEFKRDNSLIDENEAEEIKRLIEHFKKIFETGENINYHLSRQAFDSERFDTLLNAWNIKHIHLSTRVSLSKNSMKRNRSEWLLFCIVDEDTAYFLDVLHHPVNEHFMSYHLLQIVHRNHWMQLIGFNEIEGAIPGSLELKITEDEDIYKLYKCKINILFEFEDRIYISSGIASSGDRVVSSISLMKLRKFLRKIFTQNCEYLRVEFDSDDSLNGTIYFNKDKYKKVPFEELLT